MPRSLAAYDMNLTTIISPIDKDAYGKPLSPSMKSTIGRLRKWDLRSDVNVYVYRNLKPAFIMLDRIGHKLALSDAVIENAAYIYRKATEKGLARGRSIPILLAAALYAALRDTETPWTLNDIANSSNVKRKEIARCYRALARELDMKVPVPDPMRCAARIANKVSVKEKTKRKALGLLKKAEEVKISVGKNPMSLAAAALYIACRLERENKTQEHIANAAGITGVTLRKRYQTLNAALNL